MNESHRSATDTAGVLAIEVGSSRVKLAYFAGEGHCTTEKPANTLPLATSKLLAPTDVLVLEHQCEMARSACSQLEEWVAELPAASPQCLLASVQPIVAAKLVNVFEELGWPPLRQVTWEDLRLEVHVEAPSRVGVDRLLNAVAANALREPAQPAVVVDLGTAITVDLIGADGAFEGGAILPGMSLSARSLHSGTSSLPEIDVAALQLPVAAVGKSTNEAIAAGLYWGSVGSVRGIIEQVSQQCPNTPQLYVTGGAAPQVVQHFDVLDIPARHVPYMVLSAIHLVGEQLR